MLVLLLPVFLLFDKAHATDTEKLNYVSNLNWYDKNVRWSGWVHQTYVQTEPSRNKISEDGVSNTEVGLRLDLNFGKYLDVRSLLAYQPARPDNKPLEFVFSLVDVHGRIKTFNYGIKVGRLEMPFSIRSSAKNIPSARLSPLEFYPHANTTWAYNARLFTSVDGYLAYVNLVNKVGVVSFTYGSGSRNLTGERQEDYVQGLDGIIAIRQDVNSALQIDFIAKDTRIRFVNLGLTTVFDITDDHWESYLSNQLGFPIPKQMWVTGEATIDYSYSYAGIDHWFTEYCGLQHERITFKYMGTGSAIKYYDAVGVKMRTDVNTHLNYMLRCLYRQHDAYIGKTHNVRTTGSKENGSDYVGYNYTVNKHWRASVLAQKFDHYGWLLWSENRGKLPLTEEEEPSNNWILYALGLTYSF